MNALERYVQEQGLEPVSVMNWLQDRGLVADEAVFVKDVPDEDGQKAIDALERDVR